MDLLSEILQAELDTAALLTRYDYRGAWGVELREQPAAGLHYVEEGDCWLRLAGEEPLRLQQGDVVLLPTGASHALSDRPRRRTVPLATFLERAQFHRGPGELCDTRVVCAAKTYKSEPRIAHPLLRELPPLIHLRGGTIQACPTLAPCLHLLVQELREEAPGRSAAVTGLLDMFVLYVVRHWLSERADPSGWLGAIRDPRIARALQAIHERPAEAWTVARLAKVAGMSRPAFARVFRGLTQQTPAGYLARVRIHRAAHLLTSTTSTLAEIAEAVGYATEFALSRAFKRLTDEAPSAFRARRASAPRAGLDAARNG